MDARMNPLRADAALERKLLRLARGGSPRVLDLFSGCGGISLGFQRAGFEIAAAMEIDEWAARSHAWNFHGQDKHVLAAHSSPRDITAVDPEEICEELSLGHVEDAIDVLVGGPPCQAYARVGRAKLREVADHPQAFKVDPRRNLYLRYIEYVDRLKPLALLMENVPDIMNQAGHNVIEEIVELLDGHGYDARYSLINTAFHGVPQMRDRVFLVGYRRELGIRPMFPRATNHMVLPPGYAGTRAVALRFVDLLGGAGYVQADLGGPHLPFAVTAEEAIGDLPEIDGDSVRRGPRRPGPNTFAPYRRLDALSDYAKLMRGWPGFEAGEGVNDHLIRYLPRDGKTFRAMPEGAEYPEAHEVAMRLFEAEASAQGLRPKTKAWDKLQRKMVPPYRVGTFPNRWWKLRRDFPARTLMAHLGKDCYSHIHYDGSQKRTISIREAARLQSFPDGFRLAGTMNPSLRQIGNAVPPVMAWEIAKLMRAGLADAVQRLTESALVA